MYAAGGRKRKQKPEKYGPSIEAKPKNIKKWIFNRFRWRFRKKRTQRKKGGDGNGGGDDDDVEEGRSGRQ